MPAIASMFRNKVQNRHKQMNVSYGNINEVCRHMKKGQSDALMDVTYLL